MRGVALPSWTSPKRDGPTSSDACSAVAKQVSARDRSALSEVVRGGSEQPSPERPRTHSRTASYLAASMGGCRCSEMRRDIRKSRGL